MVKFSRFASMVACVLTLTPPAVAETRDGPPGAASCSGCHATNAGIDSPVPRLNGVTASATMAAMLAFKTGQRPATVMDRLAKGFSEAEIQSIAEWYAQQK
jgi:cytochrome c553